MRLSRVVLIVLITAVMGFMLVGCWDTAELNDITIVLGIGIDKNEQTNAIDMTMQLGKASVSAGGGSSGGTGGGQSSKSGEGDEYLTIRRTGASVSNVFNELGRYIAREIFLPDNQVIIFGEEAAKEGIARHLDFFMRERTSRPDVNILVADGKAYDALITKSALEKIPAVNLAKILQNQESNSQSDSAPLIEVMGKIGSKTEAALIPMVEVANDEIKDRDRIYGMAVFKRDKMIGKLDEVQTRGVLWVKNKVERGIVELKDANGEAVLEIKHSSVEMSPKIEGDELTIKVDIKDKCTLSSLRGYENISADAAIELMQKTASEQIQVEIMKAVSKAKDLDCDFLGFAEEFHKKYPAKWEELESGWNDLFKKLHVEIKVQTSLINIGKMPIKPEQ